jgi:hypothetical protein
LLLATFAISYLGPYLWIEYQRSEVKSEVKWRMIDGIDREELVLLKFSKQQSENELHWEHSKEFEYMGEMYDVVERKTRADSVFYWCWWDYEETELNRKLASLLQDVFGSDRHQQKEQLVTQFIKSLFWSDPQVNQPIPNNIEVAQNKPYDFSLKTALVDPPEQPPKFG